MPLLYHAYVYLEFLILACTIYILAPVLCYQVINKYFLYDETVRTKYALMILIPTLLIFLASEYISLNIYGDTITIEADGSLPGISPFPILFIQILGIASLFCIMFSYKKLMESFKLSRELSLLELEKHSLNQYVHIAKLNGRICGAKRSHSVFEQPNCYQSV